REAAAALRFTARPQHREDLAGLFATPDKELKHLIGLAMAAVGDERAASEVFAVQNAQSLVAAHMLRQISREHLYGFFDAGARPLRTQALLLCLLTELGERPATPGACLAGLAAAHLDIRLQAAAALEQYAEPQAFLAAVSELFNARGPEPWKVPAQTVAAIAALLAHAEPPVSLAVAEGLLETLGQAKQEVFDHWWSIASARYVIPELAPAAAGISREQLLPLVIGTYVGILRLKDDAARPIYRQSALKRLAGLAVAVPEQAEAIVTCLKVSLYDGSAVVRDEAFERLRGMTPAEDLAAEALGTEFRDVARKAMELLLAQGQAKATLALLSELQLTATNGIEEEAHEALVRKQGLVPANAAALAARSASLRSLAVRALANLCESDQAARQQLYAALASGFADVRQSAACFLAGRQDKQALPVLAEMLASREHKLTRQALQAFDVLGDAAAAGLMLGLLEKEPAHPLADEMFDVIAEIGDEAAAQRALKLIPGHSRLREGIYEAVLQISGYDQNLKFASPKAPEKAAGPQKPAKKNPEKAPPKVIVDEPLFDKPRELRDGLIEQLLKALSESGESALLAQLIPKAAFSEPAAVDKHLDALSKFKDAAVREAAVSATALRLREFGTKAAAADPVSLARRDTLRAALGHPEADTKFLAAEGLALAGHDDGIQVLLTAVDLLQNLSYRQRAVLALGQLAHPRSLDLLLRLANHEDHALQEPALEAIGHMRASEQAAQIFALLKKFVLGEREGLKLRALEGLRWFDAPEGWRLIRQAAAEPGRLQAPAIALLAHDSDPEAAVQCLARLIREWHYHGIVYNICRALQQLCSAALEAEYLFLQSPNQTAMDQVAEGYLEHVCKAGDAARLLESLEKISNEEVFEAVKSALLNREPLPAAEALARLPQASRAVSDVILQILGRARHQLPAAELAALAAGYWQQWLALRAEDPQQQQAEKAEELRGLLERVAWLSGRLDTKNASVPESFRAMLEDPDPAARSIRLAVLQALLESASVPKELLPVLGQLASQGESELRPLASALLQKVAPAELDAEALLATPQALLQLDFRQQLLARPALLAQATEIGTGLDQFTPDDIPALARLLSRYVLDRVSSDQVLAPEISPQTIASIIEILGHLQTEAAEAALADFARAAHDAHDANKDDKQIQELGNLAARLQRRSGRQRHKKAPTDWLEVTV
ncbi:MAG: HEAT repeat domain-containing protein, partial [Candidatus Sericytochromatia bacterium]